MNHRVWRGILERPTTGSDRNSGVVPDRFPFGVRLIYAHDIMVVTVSGVGGFR
jgi:hypothetical protein